MRSPSATRPIRPAACQPQPRAEHPQPIHSRVTTFNQSTRGELPSTSSRASFSKRTAYNPHDMPDHCAHGCPYQIGGSVSFRNPPPVPVRLSTATCQSPVSGFGIPLSECSILFAIIMSDPVSAAAASGAANTRLPGFQPPTGSTYGQHYIMKYK